MGWQTNLASRSRPGGLVNMNRPTRALAMPLVLSLLVASAGCGGLQSEPGVHRQRESLPPTTPDTIGNLGLCAMVGSGGVTVVRRLAAGARFVVGYGTGRIVIYGDGGARVETSFQAHADLVRDIAVSADGALFASTSDSGEVRLWDITSATLVRQLADTGSGTFRLALSPDGALLAMTDAAGLQLRATADGAALWPAPVASHGAASFSRDGQALLHWRGLSLVVRSVRTGEQLREIPLDQGVVAYSGDGAAVLTSRSRTSSIALLRVADGKALWSVTHPSLGSGGVVAAFSPDGTQVAYATRAGDVAVLDAGDGRVVRTFSLPGQRGEGLDFSGDGQSLLVGSAQGALSGWHLASGEARVREAFAAGHRGPISKAAFSPSGDYVASLAGALPGDRTLMVWRATDYTLMFSDLRHVQDGSRRSFAFSDDGATIALAGGTIAAELYLLRARNGELLHTITGVLAAEVAFSPDGGLLVAATGFSHARALRAWRLPDRTEVDGFGDPEAHDGAALTFSADGALLATGNAGNRGPAPPAAVVYRVADRQVLWSVPGGQWDVSAPAFSPVGGLLAVTFSRTGETRVYEAASGRPITTLPTPGALAAAFSPDGSELAVAGEGGLETFAVAGWQRRSHIAVPFTAVAFSPDGRAVMAGARDGTLRLYCGPIE
jgi:WD40 repeat protein